MISHMVYFTLNDSSADACNHLVAECHKYLKDHPGVEFFAAGTRIEAYARDVNDKEFHVTLNVVFDTRENQDAYQIATDHLEFIDRNKDNWAVVRVFDAEVK